MTSYGRALSLVTISSLSVPVIGLASAPLLAQSLGAVGRGEVGAAMAPHLLIVGGATFGLPAAITYYVSKRPERLRSAITTSSLLSLPLALGAIAFVATFGDLLSGGDPSLSRLMLLGTLLAIPALGVGLLRGAAMAEGMWKEVALEKIIGSLLRLAALFVLVVTGTMTVAHAFTAIVLSPVVGGLVYLRMAIGSRPVGTSFMPASGLARDLMVFGSRVWIGSIAFVLLARSTDLLMTPLSGTAELGIFLVAVTISDIPHILSQAVYGVLYSTSSASMEVERIGRTSRCCLLLSVVGALTLGVSAPFWIGIVFGAEFTASLVPTWLLLFAACAAVPGVIVGAGLDASGRPGTRSVVLIAGVVVNVALLIVLVPAHGAIGAAIAGAIASTLSSIAVVLIVARLLHAPVVSLFVLNRRDIVDLWGVISRLVRRRGFRVRRDRS